jgi:prepilin-type N-terminal cleavage/methylation domain-containing protein
MIVALFNRQRPPCLETGAQPVLSLWKAAFRRNRFRNGPTTEKSHRPAGLPDLQTKRSKAGFTLVEMSITIAIILVLVGGASLGIQPYIAYRDGRTAGEMLSAVKAAQLMYLSDFPATPVTSLTPALILPYMPHGTWPTLPLVGGVAPTINCAVFPPVALLGATSYDPSGSATDSLWDAGPQ